MIAKVIFFVIFLLAEIGLGFYSMFISDSLLARFLFFILSAVIVCGIVIQFSHKLLPDDDRRKKPLKSKKTQQAS